MNKKKKELGKGIRALLQNMDAPEKEQSKKTGSAKTPIQEIPVDYIRPNPDQPRNEFDQEQLEELALSIKSLGIIQPLTLRKISDSDYQIIAGERRYRASKLAGLQAVPAYIRKANDVELLEMALVENIQRQDLNPVEVAISFDRLIRECGITQEELSGRVGKNRSTIANYIRLLKLPPEVQKALKAELITMGHAKALAGVEDPVMVMSYFKDILQKHLSVRKTEELVSGKKGSQTKPESSTTGTTGLNSELKRIIDRLSSQFGTRVKLTRNNKGQGKIIIPFKSDKEFNDILDRLEED